MPHPPPTSGSTPTARDADDLFALVRASGGRLTPGRRAVIEALLDAEGGLTAEELVSLVHRRAPSVVESSVYRTLDSLEKLGVAHHTHLGHGAARWRLARDGHQYLVCESCGTVTEIPSEWFAPALQRIRDELGFEVALRHFALSGHCERCR